MKNSNSLMKPGTARHALASACSARSSLSSRTSRKTIPAALAAIVAATLAGPTVAIAQESTFALEEVLVTATRRTESIQDVPVSVTSLTTELQEASLRRLDDIQSFTPNVYLRKHSSAPGGLSIAIRGVSSSEYDKSFDPSIGVIMDGLVLGTASGSMMQNFDTKQIEVLRGPQGTLFGKNTTGGVVNIIRGDITMEWGVDASLALGTDGREEVKAVVNVPLIDDTLGMKVMVSSVQSDGYFENVTLDKDVGGDDMQTYGAALLWRPTEDFDLKFHYEVFEDDSDVLTAANGNTPGAFACDLEGVLWPVGCASTDTASDKDNVTGGRESYAEAETEMAILTANWDLDKFLLTSITAYQDKDEQYLNNFDPSPADFLYLNYFNEWEQFSQELRITSQFSDTIQFVGGLYYWDVAYEQYWDVGKLHYNLDRVGAITGVPGGAGFTEDTLSTNGQEQETTSIAAFFSGDWNLNDQWTLTAGARYTQEEKDFSGGNGGQFYEDGSPRPDVSAVYQDFDETWSEVTPKVGFSYRPNDDMMVFGSYTEGFKSGGYFGRQSNFVDVDAKYEPEYVNTFELGLKSEWLGGRMIFNPTIFLNSYEDKQESVLIPISLTNVSTVVRNAGELDIFGAELEVLFQVTEAWNLRANYGYLDAEYDSFDADLNGDTVVTDNSGLTPRNTPENSFGITSTYVMQLGNGELSLMGSYRWRDEVYTLAGNEPESLLDSIQNLDATISYSFGENGRYRVSAFGRNITDEREANFAEIGGLTGWYAWNRPASYGMEFAISM
ncbi:MAG: TonB-dependent receptor [Halieaceae bacterium]|nr:TonB-dependent receptor [Halieaceae bacterium]